MFACNRIIRSTVLALLLSATALAQSAVTGAVAGNVTDASNAPVPTASVVLHNADTNKEETITTGTDGGFRFSNLQPGTYALRVNVPGFTEYKQEGILIEVGKVRTSDVALKVGTSQTTVDIVADVLNINTESKEFSSNIDQTQISELPINGRRWSNFVILTPGVVPDGSFGLLSFRGVSGLLNNNTVDGGDNNQAFFGEERGRTRLSYSISQSAIREFQVNTSNYSAEYGRAAGGVTNAVTKSGTNNIHGDFFYFQRNNAWGARNPLAFQSIISNGVTTRVGIKPEDVRHQFGGTIGGPVVKDKLFYFFSYDQQKRNFPGLGILSSPSYFDTVNRATLQAAPRNLTDTQINNTLSFLNSLTGTVPRTGDQLLLLPKFDWQVNTANKFTIDYNRVRWNSPAGIQTGATNTRGKASFGDDFVKVDSVTTNLTSVISSRMVNEFRIQKARDFEYEFSQTPAPGEPRTGLNATAPDVFLTNGLEFGKPTFLERPKYPEEKRTQFTDNFSFSMGRNTLKFGVDFNHVSDVLSNLQNESGAYSYSNINDFIIDYVNFLTPLAPTVTCATTTRFAGKCYTSNYNQGFGQPATAFATTDYNFYVQYNWKPVSRLTIDTGLRYEYQKLPDAQNPNPSTTEMIPNTQLNLNQATSHLPSDKNNFGPRIGFALDVMRNGKTAIRSGYGLYYGRTINSTIYNALINTGATGGISQSQTSLAATNAAAPIFPNVLPSAPAGTSAIQYFSPNFSSPMIHQFDFAVERQISKDTAITASYLMSQGRKLPSFYDRNLSPTTATQTYTFTGGPMDGQTVTVPAYRGARPDANYSNMTEIVSTVRSSYNALALQANRRLSRGLQFQVSYTLSKATDTLQKSTTFTAGNTPSDVFNPEADNGRSNFDRRNKFVASTIYAPRVKTDNHMLNTFADGWSIAPIYQFYTGQPIDGGISGSLPSSSPANAAIPNATSSGINGSGGTNRLALVGRNFQTGPHVWNVDLRVSRRFYIGEKMNAEFLAEGFNIFNRTQVTGLNSTYYAISGTAQAAVLTYQTAFKTTSEAGGTIYRERQIQLGIRFHF